MEKNIEELYAIEGRNPWSIRRWLRGESFPDEIIDIALKEFAEKIANGYRYGYENGISILSRSIRERVKELSVNKEARLSDVWGWYLFKKPYRQIARDFILRTVLRKSRGD